MFEVTFLSALFAGLITFFAPCTLPLLPGYVAFIGGSKEESNLRRHTMENALLFVLGFSAVFIAFGIASGVVGKFFLLYRTEITKVGGIMVILLGLSLLDLVRFPYFFSHGVSWRLPQGISAGSPAGAFLLGFLFALGWTPCLGPVLGTILLLASTGGTILYGGLLLGVYSLGLAVPFLLVAFLYGSTVASIPKFGRYLPHIRRIGGMLIVGIGLLLVFGQFGILNTWVTELLGQRFFGTMAQYM